MRTLRDQRKLYKSEDKKKKNNLEEKGDKDKTWRNKETE